MSQWRAGGFTAVAEELTKAHQKLVTRQGVYMWWTRRERNQFPDRQPITSKNGVTKLMFNLDEVLVWYDWYMSSSRQGRRSQVFTSKPKAGTVGSGRETDGRS
jgi:hypothetical protein